MKRISKRYKTSEKLSPSYYHKQKISRWEFEEYGPGKNKKKIAEVLSLAKNFSHRAYLKDPMHRIIKIRQDKNSLSIFTSENQLSERLPKKIHETFKNLFSKPILHRAKGGDPFLVIIETKKI